MPPRGARITGKHARGLARPHVWKIGPNEELHKMYQPWLCARAQANFRKEGFDLTFEQWCELWMPLWHRRGRKPDDVCMTRVDIERPWTWGNVIIIERKDHFEIQNQQKSKKQYKRRGRPPKAVSVPKQIKDPKEELFTLKPASKKVFK